MNQTRSMLALVLMLLGGCGERAVDEGAKTPQSRGRYSGIGTFPASRMWQQADSHEKPSNDRLARLSDDQQIIVVVDSQTGEVRQCGDQSGRCVSMNPWSNGQKLSGLPVLLKKHADELDAEQAKASEQAKEADKTTGK